MKKQSDELERQKQEAQVLFEQDSDDSDTEKIKHKVKSKIEKTEYLKRLEDMDQRYISLSLSMAKQKSVIKNLQEEVKYYKHQPQPIYLPPPRPPSPPKQREDYDPNEEAFRRFTQKHK